LPCRDFELEVLILLWFCEALVLLPCADDEGGVEPPIALFEDEALLEPLLLGILAFSILSRRV
jgi:hypothetical protein